MWRPSHRPILIALSLGACGPQVVPLPPRESAAAAPATADASWEPDAGATGIAPGTAPPPPAMTLDEAWAWLGEELPEEIAELRVVDDALLEQLLAWAPPDGAITAYDRRCRPLRLFRNEGSLDGDIHVKTRVRGKRKTVSGESISFSWTVTVICGFDNEYERGANGEWEEVGASATGCADTVGFGLSSVTGTAAWYGGAAVDVQVRCGRTGEVAQRCLDGTERTCASCARLALEIRSRQPGYGIGSASSAVRASAPGERVDCSVPCPADELTPRIPAANAALKGVRFEKIGLDGHPLLFRTRAACREYRQRHRIPADELDVW